jgi:hypothetical protein
MKMQKYWMTALLALNMVLLPAMSLARPGAVAAADAADTAAGADSTAQAATTTDPSNPQSPVPKTPLQGMVEHSASVAPVPLQLMPGGKFDEASMPKVIPGNYWYPVPAWMAGTWQFKTETVTFLRTFTKQHYPPVPFTLKNEFQKVIGMQKDKSGQVWDYVKAPYSYTAKLNDGLIAYVNETSIEIVRCTETEVVRKLVGQDSVVDPTSQEIMLTNQKECFNRHTRLGEDALHIDGSTKIFDMNGNPTVLKFSNMLAMRTKPFEVIDEKDGQNLKQMFGDFLKAQGKADLVP